MKVSALENQFKIKSDDIKNAVKGVIKFASENPHLQNKLFNEEIPLFLQINSFKIPKTQGLVKQVFRVPLETSPLPSDADICLIVPDVKGIPNKEHEQHIEHYETLLRAKNVGGIKKIMTFHEFRTEYDTFELKNRLVDLYDLFLVDGRISGKVVHKCGSIFYKKRKVPVAVKLHIPKLKDHIQQSLKKAFFQINLKSDSHCVQIGHSKMKSKSLIENVYSVVNFIDKQYPGKMGNIRSLNIYTYRGSSIPIFVSLKNPNDVKVPVLSGKKPKAYKSLKGELTTQFNADVVVRPSGEVLLRRKKIKRSKNDQNKDENITDVETIRENEKIDMSAWQSSDNKTEKGKKRKHSQIEDIKEDSLATTLNKKDKSSKEFPQKVNETQIEGIKDGIKENSLPTTLNKKDKSSKEFPQKVNETKYTKDNTRGEYVKLKKEENKKVKLKDFGKKYYKKQKNVGALKSYKKKSKPKIKSMSFTN